MNLLISFSALFVLTIVFIITNKTILNRNKMKYELLKERNDSKNKNKIAEKNKIIKEKDEEIDNLQNELKILKKQNAKMLSTKNSHETKISAILDCTENFKETLEKIIE